MTKARDLGDFISDGTIAETVTADGLNLGDNEKIQLGASQDLAIYHDGNTSRIDELGTGNLDIRANDFRLMAPDDTVIIYSDPDDNNSIGLYHQGNLKIKTASTGATVTGTIAVSDSFNATSGTFTVQSNGTDILNLTSTVMSPQTDGAISLGSATNGFNNMYLDGNVFVGTTSQIEAGSVVNVVAGSDYAPGITIGSTASATNWARLDFNNTNATGNGIIYQDQSGNFSIRNDGANPISFLTNGANERFRIGSSGELGIGGATYGTAGQVLTSGGSGAAPTWADAGGGGAQYDFTADGAISAGDVVALTGAGNAKVTIASSYTAPSDIGFGAGFSSGDRQTSHATCPRTGRKVFVATYANNLYGIGYTYSGGTYTYGSNTVLKNGSVKNENVHAIATGRADGEFVFFYQNSSTNYIQFRVVTVASDRTVSTRSDGEYTLDTQGNQILFQKGIALIGGPNQTSPVIACFHDNTISNDYFATINAIQVNSSSVSIGSTSGNLSVGTGSNGRTDDFANLVWDSTNSRLIAAWKENGGNASVRFITNSGTTLTVGSRVSINPLQGNSNTAQFNLVWDDDANHGVIFHWYSSDAVLVARTMYSDGSISPTYTLLDNGSNGASGKISAHAGIIDPNKGQIVYRRFGAFLGVNQFCFYVVKVTSGGDIVTVTAPSVPIIYRKSTTDAASYNIYDNRGTLGYHYDDYNDIIMSPFYYRSSSSQPVVSNITIGTTYDYLGIADNTVTNGQTVTVNLAGSIDENQTGLSTGVTYYTGDNGALAASGDRKVGKALSSTAILITGAND